MHSAVQSNRLPYEGDRIRFDRNGSRISKFASVMTVPLTRSIQCFSIISIAPTCTFVYACTKRRLRYDGNLRSAIALSIGRYVLLMGNDDELSDPNTLQFLHDELERFKPVSVAVTNYREIGSGRSNRRIPQTKLLGQGPQSRRKRFAATVL